MRCPSRTLADTQRSIQTRRPAPPHQPFDADALLTLMKRLDALGARGCGCGLYIRPTIIGTGIFFSFVARVIVKSEGYCGVNFTPS